MLTNPLDTDRRLKLNNMIRLEFIKLGGSLITEKDRPGTPRLNVLDRIAAEIAAALREDKTLRLVLGHGSGSFGHYPAQRYGTRSGVHTPEEWLGFAEVWQQAAQLNRLVVEALVSAGMPAIAFPPSASVIAQDGKVASWDLSPIQSALQVSLLPVIYGDVVFDTLRGGTILSTEDLFSHLAPHLHPHRILLAGIESGVWADYPERTQLVSEITPHNLPLVAPGLSGSAATDVTGGMASKVQLSLELVSQNPNQQVLIFSGEQPGYVQRALLGDRLGTLITSDP